MGRRARAKRLGQRRRLVGLAGLVLVSVALLYGAAAAGLVLSSVSRGSPPPAPRTAAIVDQLSLTQPNPTFVETATHILEEAGYAVDYYPGEEVTIDFYRNLPTHSHDLIVLRVHSGLVNETCVETGSQTAAGYVGLFTSEPFSYTEHVVEQDQGRLGRFTYHKGGDAYFGITPRFVTESMNGGFDDTTVIMMGCNGMTHKGSGEDFVRKGAEAYIGWTERVSAAHTDAATERLLELLLLDGLTTREAVARTMAEVGPDPASGGELRAVTAAGG